LCFHTNPLLSDKMTIVPAFYFFRCCFLLASGDYAEWTSLCRLYSIITDEWCSILCPDRTFLRKGACPAMIDILKTRLIHIKKQRLSVLFWLLLPIVATVMIIHVTNAIHSDTKVPIAILSEEVTDLADKLFYFVKKSLLIKVHDTTDKDAF